MTRVLNVAGLNSYTERKRVSIVVNDPRRGKDSYTLYACGTDEGMREVVKMNIHERNNYKKLVVNLKTQGLKQLIFAKKELPKATGQSFIKTFQLIRRSKKDQRDIFEKLALEIEKDLEFLGCMGYKYDLMEGAEELVKDFKLANMKLSILTGDKLENTIPILKALRFVNTDFRDSSQFYSLRFKSSHDAYKEINRYMEILYEKIREKKVEDNIITPPEDEKTKDKKKLPMNVSTFSVADKSNLIKNSFGEITEIQKNSYGEIVEKVKTDSNKLVSKKQQNKSLKKCLLISGATMDIILDDIQLIHHFKFMLIFASNIIGYNFKASQKAILV